MLSSVARLHKQRSARSSKTSRNGSRPIFKRCAKRSKKGRSESSPVRVGLTGGIGSGKSEVARMLASLGASIIDADALAREVVAPGTEGFAQIAARWPQVVRGGALDRAALAAIVFDDATERTALNAIVHPRVRARAAELEGASSAKVTVHVVPLLFEGDYWKECDATIAVIAPVGLRIARVIARDGLSREEVERRIAAQVDPQEARRRATYAIENDADLATLEERTRSVWERLTRTA
ncbi:MAG: dephospho-CoA kinase [Candidatus Eremiobacteraeota bacterium]|nr:dephospho-CoA kinase [Candidatus Eremiobacteraeota bacterium]